MTDRVRIAVAGAGRAFERLYLPALAYLPAIQLAAVADPLPERAALAGEDVPRYSSLKQLLSNETVEGVLVLTQASDHVSSALAALARGLPVLVEKPIALAPAGLATLEAAGAARLLRPALARRWWPAYRKIRGDVPGLRQFTFALRSDALEWDPISKEIDVVTDLLPHGLDTARWLTRAQLTSVSGEIRQSSAIAHIRTSLGHEVEVRVSMRGQYLESSRVDGRTFHIGPPGLAESGLRRLLRQPDPSIAALAEMLLRWAGIIRGNAPGNFPTFADGSAVVEALAQFRENAVDAS
jgi:predicted dehydrogenase